MEASAAVVNAPTRCYMSFTAQIIHTVKTVQFLAHSVHCNT